MIAPWLILCVALAVAEPLTADAAVALALERSPTLVVADAAVVRAEGSLRAARGLRHDPELSASIALVGEAWSLDASQPLSLPGEGLAARAAAVHGLEAAEAERRRVELEVCAETRRVWVGAVAAQQQAVLAARALEVAKRIESVAKERVTVGEVSQLDLRLARLRVEQARTAWIGAAVSEGRSVAALAALVGLEPRVIELSADPLAGAPAPGEGSGSERSDIAAAEAALHAARATLARERASSLPAISLGAFVEREGAELRAGPQLSLTLPMWRANVDGRTDALAEVAVASAQRANAERRAVAEQAGAGQVSGSLEAAVAAQDLDLLAEARAALDSVALGYDRGELDLLSVSLLQAEILGGQEAWLEGRRLVAEARIDQLLAYEDPRLLGERGPLTGGVTAGSNAP